MHPGKASSKRAAMTLFARFADHVDVAVDVLVLAGTLSADLPRQAITVEPPRDTAHGDLATNAAMVLAKPARTQPRVLAEALAVELRKLPDVAEVAVAGPGFLNLTLTGDAWRDELMTIREQGLSYGRSTLGAGRTVNVEYVSANPTGPMHMGHCRGAVVGDALANLLEFAGHRVTREYYVNDAGGQVDVLARSAHLRYREALGESVGAVPEGLYPGDYLVPVGQALAAEFGDRFSAADEREWLEPFRTRAVAAMLELIKADLALLGIHHDLFSSEAELQAAGKPEVAEAELRARDLIYDGVLEAPKGDTPDDWEPVELPLFRSTRYGDDQDRPIRKSNGQWTYFGADLAYHYQKAAHADELIDIWGADHAGTVKRIQAAVQALTGGKRFDVKLVQMVRLLRGGEPVKMSKRAGNFVTLADVVREVGKDVVRFTMLTRRSDAQMDFDFARVVEASKDNPVFYVQYAHARIAKLRARAAAAGIACESVDLSRLDTRELQLVQLAAQFPRQVETAAGTREPHRIAFYLYDLAAAFHSLYNLGNDDPLRRFVREDDGGATCARLFLADAIGQVIRNGLGIMGVEAVTEM